VYDILQQRSNISHSVTDYGYNDSRSNVLNSYFIVHFIYRFQAFKGGANASDARRGGPDGGRAPGGPPPGGGRPSGPPTGGRGFGG
jgi:hypothetical protein